MFIDIHVHACKTATTAFCGRQVCSTPEQILPIYEEHEIESGVVLPIVSPECTLLPQSNEEILELCQMHPGRLVPFCNLDPRAFTNSPTAPLREALEYYRDRGCRGIGEVTANLPFNDAKVENLFAAVQEVGFPLIFHVAPMAGNCYGLIDESAGLPLLENALRRFPKLIFIGHSPGFWTEIARLEKPGDRMAYPKYPVREEGVVPKLMRDYENLHGDLSAGSGYNALARDPEYAVRFLNEFQDRLYYGTDICAPRMPSPLDRFLLDLRAQGGISEEVFGKVARENARRLLGLA